MRDNIIRTKNRHVNIAASEIEGERPVFVVDQEDQRLIPAVGLGEGANRQIVRPLVIRGSICDIPVLFTGALGFPAPAGCQLTVGRRDINRTRER